jgi:phosphonate utilization transcriptional regulator
MAGPVTQLQILQTRSVPELVREEFTRLIVNGELVSGDKLNEIEFAQRFRVSRAPIREAFRALEEAGLVRLEKNRGVFVRKITEPEARELYELRGTLAEMAGRQLASRITKDEIAELEDWLIRLRDAALNRDMAHYFRLNIGFHDRMVEMTGNTTLLEFYRMVIGRMHLMRRRNFSVSLGWEKSQVEHRAIVNALKTGNPEKSASAMHLHVMKGYERLTALLRRDS